MSLEITTIETKATELQTSMSEALKAGNITQYQHFCKRWEDMCLYLDAIKALDNRVAALE